MSENENLNQGTYVPPKNNGMAVASLVLGICSIVFCWVSFIGLVCGVLAIIFGVVAKNKIKTDPQLGGAANASAGLVTGIIGVVLWVVVVIVITLFFTAAFTAIGESGEFQEALKDLSKELDKLD
jgi:hypothetical protein